MTIHQLPLTNALARHGLITGRWSLVVAVIAFSATLSAQGSISGTLKDPAGTTTWFETLATVGAIVLPDESHPFNEITAATWQEAMTALSEGRAPETPFGRLTGGITPLATHFVQADADGSFRLDDLPLEQRIGIAARVGDVWWPVAREFWLTESQPQARAEIPFFTLDAGIPPPATLHELDVALMKRPDLRYASVAIIETLRFENHSPAHAAMVEIELELALPPGIQARHLPSLYGSQLLFMQGTGSLPANIGDANLPLARQAWRFGGGDMMHGTGAVYSRGPQRSSDNWHRLNIESLHMIGGGDTQFLDKPSPTGRSASLVFRRPVPPALHGEPGTLVIAVLHNGGIPVEEPTALVPLKRGFPFDVQHARANLDARLSLQALLADGHRSLYTTAETIGDMLRRESTGTPALNSGATVQFVIGLTPETQAALRQAVMPTAPGPGPVVDVSRQSLRWYAVFIALAIVFGIAFCGALIASIRKPREQQLDQLAELPASRAEVLSALAQLETEYKAGKLPASAYVSQKQRLMNRLVEFDVKRRDQPQ
jgi:hypothetical protein